MPHMSKTLLSLGVVLTIAGSLTLFGCTATNGQAEVEDVNNKSFTFANGAVFHPGLAGAATTLQFTDNANTFTLASAGGIATGVNRFGSCILMVASSTYTPETGPQVNDVITLNPCSFDSTNFTLTVSNGPNTITSNPAIARLVNATANDLNDRGFLFFSGEVFNAALVNQVVSLERRASPPADYPRPPATYCLGAALNGVDRRRYEQKIASAGPQEGPLRLPPSLLPLGSTLMRSPDSRRRR